MDSRRRWLRRGRVVALVFPGSKEVPKGWRVSAEALEATTSNGEDCSGSSTRLLRGVAGELRGAVSPLHKKTKGEALGVGHGVGKLGEEANEAGDVEVHRKMRGTAAECATLARN